MVLRTVYRAGNGLVFSIPPKMAAALKLTAGTQVAVAVSERKLTVARALFLQDATATTAPTPEDRSRE